MYLFLLLLPVAVGGCSGAMGRLVASSEGSTLPHVEGRWVGHVEAIAIYDGWGRPYAGLALRVENGPELLDPVGDARGGGRLPLLTEYRTSNYRIIPPSKLAPGSRVEVKGLMVAFYAVPPDRSPYGDVALVRVRPTQKKVYPEHIIVVKGKPKVIEAPKAENVAPATRPDRQDPPATTKPAP